MVDSPDGAEADRIVEEISKLPPLVTSWDCAENLDACYSSTIANKLKVLSHMSLVLAHGV
jgi:3-deoxy-D-arabino-heptulosonate 7-phosphate (DAHP) synthase class II